MFFLIVCRLSNFTFLLIFSYCLNVKSSSIGKVCGVLGSTCGNNEACVNGKCECDPKNNFFWTGEKLGCRICPLGYYRDANRCLKYYSTPTNRSQARENCRREQSDLFTWKDNDDESFLIEAATQIWGFKIGVYRQFYTWSGGIVQNSHGSKSDYRIVWVDPRGPTMTLPQFDETHGDRYCSMSRHWGYNGDPEPTRTVKNGEAEDCVTFVFLPQTNSRGSVCMADDYCSMKIGYICEMTEATITGTTVQDLSTAHPSDSRITISAQLEIPHDYLSANTVPSALSGNTSLKSSSTKMYIIIGIIAVLIVGGVLLFIFLRHGKSSKGHNRNSVSASVTSSMVSGGNI